MPGPNPGGRFVAVQPTLPHPSRPDCCHTITQASLVAPWIALRPPTRLAVGALMQRCPGRLLSRAWLPDADVLAIDCILLCLSVGEQAVAGAHGKSRHEF